MARKPQTSRIDKAMTIELAQKFGKAGTGEIEIDLLVEELDRRGAFNPLSLRKSQLAMKKRWIRQVLEHAVDEKELPIFVNLRMVDKHGQVYHAYKPRLRQTGPEYIQSSKWREKMANKHATIAMKMRDEGFERRGVQITLEFVWDTGNPGSTLS